MSLLNKMRSSCKDRQMSIFKFKYYEKLIKIICLTLLLEV
jgi:hypothetical protein